MPAITVEKMKNKLLTLDKVREVLSSSEPISSVGFPVSDNIRFKLEPGWTHGLDTLAGTDKVDAFIRIGKGAAGKEFQLTKDSALEATSICGLPKGYVQRTPSNLIEPQLNYWFKEGLGSKEYQVLVTNGTLASAITRSTIQPFSNLRLLEQALDGIEAKYGKGEVLADYKFAHSLRRTHLRLIVPEKQRVIKNTGTENDTWSVGLQIKNSLVGEDQTSLDGYLFRWSCTNGSIDTHATSGAWSRRGGGQGEEVYEWARGAVDEILGGLEPALDSVQALTDVPIAGEAVDVLRDVYKMYKVPTGLRDSITENMVEAENLTMYSLMQAITQAANVEGIDANHRTDLMAIGGDLGHHATERCNQCRRLLPH